MWWTVTINGIERGRITARNEADALYEASKSFPTSHRAGATFAVAPYRMQ
jgi:hypothetical protein